MIKKIANLILSYKDEKDRAQFRHSRILISAIGTLGSKGVNILVLLISVPLTYNYLGEERFGLLMTIMSFLAVMSFSDLGLGLGLLNRIAIYNKEENKVKLRTAVSSTYFFLLGFALISLCIFLLIYPLISWNYIFKVSSELAKKEAGQTMLIFTLCFLFMLPFSIIQKIQSGFQESYINDIWEASGNIFSLVLLFIVVHLELGVPYILLALYGTKSFFLFFNFIFHFKFKRPHLRPTFKLFDWDMFKSIFWEGLLFFTLQFCILFMTSVDNVIIAHFKGTNFVSSYVISYRLYSLFMLPVQAYIGNTLPAFNDAFASNDLIWIKQFLTKILKWLILISVIGGLMYFYFGKLIIQLWINRDVKISQPLILAFSFYVIYSNINSIFLSILMTPKFIKYCVIMFLIAAVLTIIFKILLIPMSGVESLLWVTMSTSFLIIFIPATLILKKNLQELDKI